MEVSVLDNSDVPVCAFTNPADITVIKTVTENFTIRCITLLYNISFQDNRFCGSKMKRKKYVRVSDNSSNYHNYSVIHSHTILRQNNILHYTHSVEKWRQYLIFQFY